MTLKVGAVVIDCNDFERMSAFWRDALGYEERFERTPEEGEDFVVLEDPEGNLFCVIDINA